jgi:hypothetical protein
MTEVCALVSGMSANCQVNVRKSEEKTSTMVGAEMILKRGKTT